MTFMPMTGEFKFLTTTVCALLCVYLLWLLFTNVCPSQHSGFDSREDLQLSTDGRDSFTDLWQEEQMLDVSRWRQSALVSMQILTCSRFVLMRLSVHCLATSFASLVTSSEALAMSLAHWISARLFPLPPRTSRDISAISRAIRLAAAMMSLPCWRMGM